VVVEDVVAAVILGVNFGEPFIAEGYMQEHWVDVACLVQRHQHEKFPLANVIHIYLS
jgi:hypothetical protein